MKIFKKLQVFLVALLFLPSLSVYSCTNFLVSKGASADGSVMITYLSDAGGFMEPINFVPAAQHEPGDSVDIYDWDYGAFLGRIAQVPYTYKVIGNMNEHQVAIGETTFTGREELRGPNGIIDYGSLKYIALQRAKTAREAIKIMVDLCNKYGYASTGESFSVADKEEVWIFEFIGKGENEKGIVWVAARVPDGYVAAHANQSRIRKINFKDKDNWMWAPDVVSFAQRKGFYDKNGTDEDFCFTTAYCPPDPISLLLCEGRVWSIYRRVAPSQHFSEDYWRAVRGAEPYPLFIKPDNKLSVGDVMNLMRDHFQGTEYDMTKGFAAGPFGNPYRWKPLFFEVEGDTTQYGWERPISTQQTGFSFVSQSRSWLPDEIGGLFWYGVDDTYSTCYMPLYMGMTEMPPSISRGHITKFDWNSAFWVFNLVANYAYGMYSYMIEDIQKVQKDLEGYAMNLIPYIDKAALAMKKDNYELMSRYLTDFSVNTAENTIERWKELGYYLFAKYNDRYINDMQHGGLRPKGPGYGNEFFRRAVEERPGYYDIRWRDE